MVISHGQLPMLNAPEDRTKRLKELKSIAKSVQADQGRKNLMMKITNNDHEDGSLELKFYLPKVHAFQFAVDCRKIDLFRRSKKDQTFFYFTLRPDIEQNQFECQMYHAVGMSNAQFISSLLKKQVELNLKEVKLTKKIMKKQILPMKLSTVEQARKYSDNEHPLDESLDESSYRVPTLLDLELDHQQQTTLKSNNSATLHHIPNLDLLMDNHHHLNKVPSCSTNPFATSSVPSWQQLKTEKDVGHDETIYQVTTIHRHINKQFDDDFDHFITKRIGL